LLCLDDITALCIVFHTKQVIACNDAAISAQIERPAGAISSLRNPQTEPPAGGELMNTIKVI
jgi:hypothetical protein